MVRKTALSIVSARGQTSTTLAGAVYEQLRADIANGQLTPESKLGVEAMCTRYKTGASPIREALSRLSAEGWVDRSELRGFRVAPLHWNELPILTRTRLEVESIALRESVANFNQETEDSLVLLMHRLSRTPRSLSADAYITNPAWEAVHRDFHRILLSCCESRWLRAFCDSLAEESYRYRQVAAGSTFTQRDELAEHRSIFEAVIARHAEAAVSALEAHYQRTAFIIGEQASANKTG